MANYIIYNELCSRFAAKPFLAGDKLLSELYVAKYSLTTKRADIGSEKYQLNPQEFSKYYAPILAQAGKDGNTIIALENSSFCSLKYAKSYIVNHPSFKDEVEKELNKMQLTANFLADTVHINGFLMRNEVVKNIKKALKYPFEGFKAAMHIGASLDYDEAESRHMQQLFDTIRLQNVRFDKEFKPSGYELYTYAPQIAYKMAGSILLEAMDGGAHFLIVNDIRTFSLFDTKRKEIEKAASRDIPIYILTLAQVVLMALGVTDRKVLGFDEHKIKPSIL